MSRTVLRQPTWPAPSWQRFGILYAGMTLVTVMVLALMTAFGSATWSDALIYGALNSVTGAPVFALVGAAVTQAGTSMLFTNPSAGGHHPEV